jgi:lipopolysaccharide/colanic/teichoic acid biosynthesis glycosyltransferase
LNQLVAAEYNVSPQEAQQRGEQTEQQATQAAQRAEETAPRAADTAASSASIAAFSIFTVMLLGAIAAVLGARRGTRDVVSFPSARAI